MASEQIQRVRIYMSEGDTSPEDKRPLHLVVLDTLQREGATGASILSGVGGFGPNSRGRGGGLGDTGGKSPLIIEWIDHAERIQQLMPLLDIFLTDNLVTIEDIGVYRAVMRSQGIFGGDKTVGDIMQREPHSVQETGRLGEAITMMLAGKQSLLPVLNTERKIIGMITEAGIASRANLHIPLHLFPLLTKEEGRDLVGPIATLAVKDIMHREWRTVPMGSFIPQALVIMLEWGYDQIPVLDRSENLAGLISWSDVLTAVIKQQEAASVDGAVRDVEPPTPVSLVMQHNVPMVPVTQTLGFALQQLLRSPDRYLVVVDSERKIQGTISDIGVFRALESRERAPLLAAIQNQSTTLDVDSIPGANRGLHIVLEHEPPTLAPREGITDAVRRLMELGLERAPVVDEEDKVQGIVGRGGLLRALVQESK
jgi:CBS-domain-containing membrane protein